MSLFTDIDSLYTQTDQLISRANNYVPPPPDEGPGGSTDPEKLDSGGSSGSSGTDQSNNDSSGSGSGDTGNETDMEPTAPEGGNSKNEGVPATTGDSFVTAVGQNVSKSWNEDIKPALASVDPTVYYVAGGTLGVLILIKAFKR